MSPRLVSGLSGKGERPLKFHILFWALFLEDSNAEKLGNCQQKKFFINNSVEATIPLKEKHQGLLLKLRVPLEVKERGSSSVAKRSGEYFEASFNSKFSTSY